MDDDWGVPTIMRNLHMGIGCFAVYGCRRTMTHSLPRRSSLAWALFFASVLAYSLQADPNCLEALGKTKEGGEKAEDM